MHSLTDEMGAGSSAAFLRGGKSRRDRVGPKTSVPIPQAIHAARACG
jgi:hypothetical protein